MATKRHFIKRGIKIDSRWAADHPEVVDLAEARGLDIVAPVVVIRDGEGLVLDVWTNYRRDSIDLWAEHGTFAPLD